MMTRRTLGMLALATSIGALTISGFTVAEEQTLKIGLAASPANEAVRYAAQVAETKGQRPYIAPGAKGLGAIATQQHADDARITGPLVQVIAEHFDHRQGEGIERLGGIQGGNADAGAIGAGQYLAMNGHGLPRAIHPPSMACLADHAGRID